MTTHTAGSGRERLMTRRDVARWAAAGVAAAALDGASGAGRAWAEAGAGTVLDYPENEGLTDEEVAARFDLIDATYGEGEAFADTDVDFVLRYGTPAPTGNLGHTQQAVETAPYEVPATAATPAEGTNPEAGTDAGAGSDALASASPYAAVLMCRTEASYEGGFSYRFTESMYLAAGYPDAVSMAAEAALTVYGWPDPSRGSGGFGIVRRSVHRHEQGEGWELVATEADEFTGIAAVYRMVYTGTVAALGEDGGPVEPIDLGPLDSVLTTDALVRRYKVNDDLTEEEQFERFREQSERYGVGDTLSEVDADFVDRYAMGSIWGEPSQAE